MRLRALIPALAIARCIYGALPPRDYDLYDYYVLHLEESRLPSDVAAHFGLKLDGQLGALEHHYLFRKNRHSNDVVAEAVREHKLRRKRDLSYANNLLDGILLHQKQELRAPHEKRGPIPPVSVQERQQSFDPGKHDEDDKATTYSDAIRKGNKIAKALNITDPQFHSQWHLYNPQQLGHDLNVTGVWMQGITGKNSTVCIVDDGLDMDSEDLKDNYFAEGSYDFNEKTEEPRPRLDDDRHGTRCAGEVSAVKNDVCGVGVAWDSKVAGIRILSKPITDADEALALIYAYQKNQIYSCSWGPPDDGKKMGAPGILIKRAMLNAIQNGRGGLGTIYVFAAGNGAASGDNCNFDGYTNSIYSITVGAIDREGIHPYYSEKCSAQLIVTYSSGSGDAIHTTDVGARNCYDRHGGTSAAGPLAAGLYALVLQVRPDLTWRDMQWLTINTAVKIDQPSDWQNTTMGKSFSHQFGYGKLDGWALVEAAKDFKSVKPQAWYYSPWQHVRHKIPQGRRGLSSEFVVTREALEQANFETLEHVTVTMNVKHGRRGDLSVELHSPSGVVSHLSTARPHDEESAGYVDWTFMSVAHWGESGIGKWKIIVKDTKVNKHNGTFVDWKLNLFGECINPSDQELLPMPNAEDDDDHDREDAVVSTTSIDVPSEISLPSTVPSDHQHRPINVKPTEAAADDETTSTPIYSPAASRTAPFVPPIDATQTPSRPHHHHKPKPKPKPKPRPTSEPSSDNFLPSPFPNFGVSKRTQIWIYGAAGLIVIFCISLAVYFWMARKKRQRAIARENYEFEIIDDEDEDGAPGMNGGVGGRRGKRRAGELYDAFAGESDEELFSDDERYQDHPADGVRSRVSSDAAPDRSAGGNVER